MTGKIIKGIAGFYYVHTKNGVYECKAKGIFRNKKIKPLVGDMVVIEVLDESDKTGNIIKIEDRNNTLIRPAVANIDQALVVFATLLPEPNFNLLDRFLIMMEYQKVPTVICFNKADMGFTEEIEKYKMFYQKAGYQVIFSSTVNGQGMEELEELLSGKTTVLAGVSGVGKSSILNYVGAGDYMDTGKISEKIGRGKHTTRHSEIFCIGEDTYVVDTPGFSSLMVMDMEPEQLRFYFPEFQEYEGVCKFHGCTHTHEPSCLVKEALEEGKINRMRYQHYQQFYKELTQKRKY